jgi:hypothetical protein
VDASLNLARHLFAYICQYDSPNLEFTATATTLGVNANQNLTTEAYQLSNNQQSQLDIDSINPLNGIEREVQEKLELKTPPSSIVNYYSVITGDPFHYTKRKICPKDHDIVNEFSNFLTRV